MIRKPPITQPATVVGLSEAITPISGLLNR